MSKFHKQYSFLARHELLLGLQNIDYSNNPQKSM